MVPPVVAVGAATLDDTVVLDALPTAVMIVENGGTIIRANQRALDILERDRLTGVSIRDVLGTWPLRVGEGGRSECSIPRRDGTAMMLGFTIAPVTRSTWAIVFQEITQWQRLREERDRLMRLAMVGESLPTILHELKNPLAAINAAVEILVEETEPGPIRDQLHAILQEARRLRLGLDGVGAVGRSLRSSRPQVIDHACREAFRVLEIPAHAAGIVTRCEVADLPLLPLDPATMRAIVFNLVTNAIHACSAYDAIVLRARLVAYGLALELTVSDTGCGMTHEVHAHCTDLFFTTKRKGSGIGLALVKQAVTEAGGRLEIESVPGVGTCVTAVVPVLTEPRDHAVAPKEGAHVSRR